MKMMRKVAIWIGALLAALVLFAHFVHWFQKRYIPPEGITNVAQVLEWSGRPWWVAKYSSPTATYYEIGKKVPVWTLTLTLASGAPSYTVDDKGKFIGWSPDSGDVHTPDVLRSPDLKRESMDVDDFLEKAKKMTPNQPSDATSEPAPGAGSSAHQG
jgi:hypothetical protein